MDKGAVIAGELEKAATPPPPPPPPPTPAADFSWGSSQPAHSANALVSLRDIQSQEAAASPRQGNHLSSYTAKALQTSVLAHVANFSVTYIMPCRAQSAALHHTLIATLHFLHMVLSLAYLLVRPCRVFTLGS